MANRWGKVKTVADFIFLVSKITAHGDCSHEINRHLLLGRKAMTNVDNIQYLKKQRYHFAHKSLYSQSYGFPVVMYRCASWTVKKTEHQRIDAFELWCWRRLKNSLDCKEIKLVNPKGNQPGILFGRTDAEAETPIFWPSDAKSQLIGKDPDAGKD